MSLAREKLAQAQNLMSAGDLWLIFGEESLEPPEPALELLTEASFTWATFLLITREEAQAIVGRYDAPSLPAFWSVEAYDEDFTTILTRALEELAPRRILLDYGLSLYSTPWGMEPTCASAACCAAFVKGALSGFSLPSAPIRASRSRPA